AQAGHTPCWHRQPARKIQLGLPTSPIPQNAHSPSKTAVPATGSIRSSTVRIVCYLPIPERRAEDNNARGASRLLERAAAGALSLPTGLADGFGPKETALPDHSGCTPEIWVPRSLPSDRDSAGIPFSKCGQRPTPAAL